ncbi:MAG: GNAT family N-acetyltransferase, partial [Desulfobacterales bacterium]|nr:GNAT family N-acetyltransferase [Desulfobacterales bacterium]
INHTNLPDIEQSEYIIRSLEGGEADKLMDIQNRAFVDTWGFNPNTRDEITYRINLSSCAPEDVIMAYLGKKPVGYCWTRLIVEENPAECRVKGEVHMLGVDPAFRHKGIGRKVMLAGLVHLKSKGVTIIDLTADGEDPVALALYESMGFEICSRSEWYEKKLV